MLCEQGANASLRIRVKTIVLAVLIGALALNVVRAQPIRYVTDEAEIPLRAGQSTEYKILRVLPSGTAVEVLEETKDGYSRVKTPQGTKGWILTRYLMSTPSARDRLAEVQQRYQQLQSNKIKLEQQLAGLGVDSNELERRNRELEAKLTTLTQELETLRGAAARPMDVSRENTMLREQLEKERQSIQRLQNENTLLRAQTRRNWFLTGAGVTLGSLFLGLIIPRIPWRRRRGWGEL